MDKPTVLVVDDIPMNLKIIERFLGATEYCLLKAKSGQEALDLLWANKESIDVVLLDRAMPGLDGLEVLQKIKAHKEFEALPVVLQTAKTAISDVQEGLNAGAFYYLTKPFEKEMLCAIVRAAINDYGRYKGLGKELRQGVRVISCLLKGRFAVKTLTEADDLVKLLAFMCPDPQRVVLGLSEILHNAIEHGNLRITYEEKTALMASGKWLEEIYRRSGQAEYKDLAVKVIVERTQEAITFQVIDKGEGFDWEKYLVLDPARAYHIHGRGIATAKMASFDWIQYKGKGNKVEMGVYLKQQRE